MRRTTVQVEAVQAVTEFNQWLRGMDETAMMLWRASVDTLAGARSRRWTTVLVMAGIQAALVVACAVFSRLPASNGTTGAITLVSGIGAFTGIATLGALRALGREVKDALARKTLLERKLGFLHGQLDGLDMGMHLPAKRDAADRLARRAGRWPLWRPTEELAISGWILHAGLLAVFAALCLQTLI